MRWEIVPWALTFFFVLAILTFVPKTIVYNTTESYVEYIPYTEKIPLKYEIVEPLRWLGDTAHMMIKNTDNVTGTYNVTFVFESEGIERMEIVNKSAILSPGKRGVVGVSRWEIGISGNITASATVIPGVKTLQSTRPELRTREAMKEKEVSLLQYFIQYILRLY
jgi:hypothetical protein